jgi:predicted DNA-binding transcriptional regulator YafY
MRASRLVSTLLLLQSRGRMTADALAAELDVSVRTVHRDIGALQQSGVPIFAESGHNGGFELVGGYTTRLTGMTRDEVEAMFLMGLPEAAADLGLADAASTARLEIESGLPAALRPGADRLRGRFLLDAPGWFRQQDPVPHLGALAEALWVGRVVHVIYQRWKEPTEVTRRLEPLRVVLKSGVWYLVARQQGSARISSYRIAKIRDLTVLSDEVRPPDDFDLSTWWRDHTADLRSRLVTGEATIRLAPHAVDRLVEGALPDVMRAVMAGTEEPDGWVRAVIPIESLIHAEKELLRLGAGVEVLEPLALRDALASAAAGMLEIYASGRPLQSG